MDAQHTSDLPRVQTFPSALLLRQDACVPSCIKQVQMAPLACAIDNALCALIDHRDDPRLWTAPVQAAPTALAVQLVA